MAAKSRMEMLGLFKSASILIDIERGNCHISVCVYLVTPSAQSTGKTVRQFGAQYSLEMVCRMDKSNQKVTLFHSDTLLDSCVWILC